MHIPDGFVNLPVAAVTGVVSAGALGYSLKKAGKELGEQSVPLLGVTAAFVFAAQMLNFPVAAGTSGHFLGALMACVLLGPWAGFLVITAVLILQALLMADGGITALGANVFNMAVIGGWLGYAVFVWLRHLLGRSSTGFLAAVAIASWLAVVLASASCALQLWMSGTTPLQLTLPAMVSVHMIIGVGEALIGTAVLAVVLRARPDLIRSLPPALRRPTLVPEAAGGASGSARWAQTRKVGVFALVALVVALALVIFVAPFASTSPDGLEKVAEDHGFADTAAEEPLWRFSPLPDYTVPAMGEGIWSTAIAGLVGVLVLSGLVLALGRVLSRASR